MVPVEALGLVRRRQAGEHHRHIGRRGMPGRLLAHGLALAGVAGVRVDPVARRERQLLRRDCLLDAAPGVVEPGGRDLRAARALVAGRLGERADHGDLFGLP